MTFAALFVMLVTGISGTGNIKKVGWGAGSPVEKVGGLISPAYASVLRKFVKVYI